MLKNIYSPMGHKVGYIEDGVYISDRDFNKSQIFYRPKYRNAMGLSRIIIKQLIQNNVEKVRFRVFNFEIKMFFAEISLNDFLKNAIDIKFKAKNSDYQKIVPMEYFTKVYPEQKRLE